MGKLTKNILRTNNENKFVSGMKHHCELKIQTCKNECIRAYDVLGLTHVLY
jgi:hypothetical protein